MEAMTFVQAKAGCPGTRSSGRNKTGQKEPCGHLLPDQAGSAREGSLFFTFPGTTSESPSKAADILLPLLVYKVNSFLFLHGGYTHLGILPTHQRLGPLLEELVGPYVSCTPLA